MQTADTDKAQFWDDDAMLVHIKEWVRLDACDPDAANAYFTAHLYEPLTHLIGAVYYQLSKNANIGDVEDFTQNFLCHLLKRLPSYDPQRGKAFSWAYNIIITRGINVIRDMKKFQRNISLAVLAEDNREDILLDSPYAPDSHPEDDGQAEAAIRRKFFTDYWTNERLEEAFPNGGKRLNVARYICVAVGNGQAGESNFSKATGSSRETVRKTLKTLTSFTGQAWKDAALN